MVKQQQQFCPGPMDTAAMSFDQLYGSGREIPPRGEQLYGGGREIPSQGAALWGWA